MNRMWNMKRLLAAILTLALLAGALPVQALAEQPEAPQAEAPQVEASQTLTDTMSDLTEPLTAGQDVKLVTYHEVVFALPAGEGEEEAEVTQMEESTLVPDGTLRRDGFDWADGPFPWQ